MRRRVLLPALALVIACGGDAPSAPPLSAGASITLNLTGLEPLEPATGGRYEAWVVGGGGARTSLGSLDLRPGNAFTLVNPVDAAHFLEITWERPGDADPLPSPHRLLAGDLRNSNLTTLSVVGAVTQSELALHERPGQFTMFSPSDNAEHGYPSFEESGVWLFNMAPRGLPQNDMWVRLTQLQPGWVYEGWMVRDIDAPGAVWLSYGKFLPDASGTINSRDDTGWGVFSGVTDFARAGEEEFPGDDWISNPLGYPVPGGLALPLNLREKDAQGIGRWTHVITIEPASDRGEPLTTERPFAIRPYRDPFGDGAPGSPRTITFRPADVPGGTATRQ